MNPTKSEPRAAGEAAHKWQALADEAITDAAYWKNEARDSQAKLAALVAALEATEARLTRVANAFYASGKAKDLQAALDGWKADAHQARAALSLAKQ